jgi:outer membrane receptor protein involved in Fe transport
VSITSQGNPNLKNEISNTLTVGAQWDPPFVPGLSLSADYIQVDLKDAIQAFTLNNFVAACFDTAPQPADICSTFTRNSQGYLVSGVSQTFNVGFLTYRGETYKLNYRLPLGENAGVLTFHAEAVHNRRYETAVAGGLPARSDGTASVPRWRGRLDLNYSKGPFRMFYSIYHLPTSKANFTATIENTTFPIIESNTIHTVSFQYDVGPITLRAGVNNLFDKAVSIPTRDYGDFFGRRAFVGARIRL